MSQQTELDLDRLPFFKIININYPYYNNNPSCFGDIDLDSLVFWDIVKLTKYPYVFPDDIVLG